MYRSPSESLLEFVCVCVCVCVCLCVYLCVSSLVEWVSVCLSVGAPVGLNPFVDSLKASVHRSSLLDVNFGCVIL